MKNSKLKGLASMSKLTILAWDMISLDSEMIRTVKGGTGPKIIRGDNGVCGINEPHNLLNL